jgi:hypothetical protein
LIEESGTTDYAGALLRFYAAEGVVQGHKVHVVGMPEAWGRELPGIAEDRGEKKREEAQERMKIAYRYERLGQFGAEKRGALYIIRLLSSDECYCFCSRDVVWCLSVLCRFTGRESNRWCGRRGRSCRVLPYV